MAPGRRLGAAAAARDARGVRLAGRATPIAARPGALRHDRDNRPRAGQLVRPVAAARSDARRRGADRGPPGRLSAKPGYHEPLHRAGEVSTVALEPSKLSERVRLPSPALRLGVESTSNHGEWRSLV